MGREVHGSIPVTKEEEETSQTFNESRGEGKWLG